MAAIFQSHPFIFPKLLFVPSPLPLFNSTSRIHTIVFASSPNKTRSRNSRKVKSNDELCNEIREFLSSVGLPHHHVPSTKELSHHGRQDLANIVRRRGYKLIRQLLETPTIEKIDTFQTEELEVLIGSEGQEEGSKLVPDLFPIEPSEAGDIHGLKETYEVLKPSNHGSMTSESNILSLEEKVAKFIQGGELDTVEDGGLGDMYDRYTEQAKRIIKSVDALTSGFNHDKPDEPSLNISSGTVVLNGNVRSSGDPVLGKSSRSNYFSTEESATNDSNKDSDIKNMEVQAEIKRLKFMLRQKEMELIELKEQIEKEKLALSVLQATAETEITKARLLISEKETELHVAEENLSGLKEVEIQYSGEGETVELAGSFNGWHQIIKMDRESASTEPSMSRASWLWRAVLWLYPGTYEIKFVVDGNWTIDPRRELTNQGGIHNNILRVDR